MKRNLKRTIAFLGAVCMLPFPQIANVAGMAQSVSAEDRIGVKTLKQSLQTSTSFQTAAGKCQKVKEDEIKDSYDVTYGDSITFFISKTKDSDTVIDNENDQKHDNAESEETKDPETEKIPDYEIPDTIHGFSCQGRYYYTVLDLGTLTVSRLCFRFCCFCIRRIVLVRLHTPG